MSTPHKHRLIYVGRLQGEFGGDWPIHWCDVCGAVVEFLRSGKMAFLIPEVSAEMNENFSVKGAEYPKTRSNFKPSETVLGRGLKDLLSRNQGPSRGLSKLFK